MSNLNQEFVKNKHGCWNLACPHVYTDGAIKERQEKFHGV
jgi:hypothetical protein